MDETALEGQKRRSSNLDNSIESLFTDKLLDLANLSPDVISYLNENYPNSPLTKKIDEYAYNIASDSGASDRELDEWSSIFEPGKKYMEGTPEEYSEEYTGTVSSMRNRDPQKYMTEPNVLASYLGMDDPRFENQEDAPKFKLSPYAVEEPYLQELQTGEGQVEKVRVDGKARQIIWMILLQQEQSILGEIQL